MEKNEKIIQSSLDEVLHNSMMPYAEHVILDRALPRVEDGLKPVQRRILYTMYELGLTPDKPHRKCAKIVGDCLGKFHPHGDSSVYDALVLMAQDFVMRATLINGHGNFGTIDGDTAAAYRYTEAKLEPLAMELLSDIEKETVDFSLNFDDTTLEPDVLPGRFPNLLVNGANGIAVGLATNIPTHNLAEVIDGTVAYIDNPKITLKEMMKYIKGPDFPTGGIVLATDELYTAYETGRGKIKLRAKVSIEKDGQGKDMLVISEIPYRIKKEDLLKNIYKLKEDKKETFGVITDVVDESDRKGLKAVIKLRREANAKSILEKLYKHSNLETTFGINMVAIADGKPKQMGLLDIISYYVNYQKNVILRRSKFELDRAKERAHILEGLIIAVKNIDAVIKVIKNSANTTEAKANLRSKFDLSDAQATAILDLRLARITKLEITKLEEELAELKKRIKELTDIIGSKRLQLSIVKSELLAIKKKYKEDRKTKIISADKVTQVEVAEEPKKEVILDYVAYASRTGKIKLMLKKAFIGREKTLAAKGDEIVSTAFVSTGDKLVIFTDLGNAFKINVNDMPAFKPRDKGVKLSDIFKDALSTEKPVAVFKGGDEFKEGYLLFFTESGLIKKTAKSEYDIQKTSYQAIKLKDDKVLAVEEEKDESTICFMTENGMILNCLKDEVPVQGRISSGVKGMILADGDKILFAGQVTNGAVLTASSSGYFKKVSIYEVEPIARGRKGMKIAPLSGGEKLLYAGVCLKDYHLAVFTEDGVSVIKTEDIAYEQRTSKGKQLKGEMKKKIPVAVAEIR